MADGKMMQQPIVRTNAAALQRLRVALREHWLTGIDCDHLDKIDQPVCACSLVDLGWHTSVGKAVEAWAQHVEDAADLTVFKLPLGQATTTEKASTPTCDGTQWLRRSSDCEYGHSSQLCECEPCPGCEACKPESDRVVG